MDLKLQQTDAELSTGNVLQTYSEWYRVIDTSALYHVLIELKPAITLRKN